MSSVTDPAQRLRHIFALWTIKEAYTKALGIGLRFEFNRIQVILDSKCQVVSFVVDGMELEDWRFELIESEDYFIAVVTERSSIPSKVHHVTLEEILNFAQSS